MDIDDIDAPVRPIDREADARRVERARAARHRSDLRVVFTLAQPLVAMSGGMALGGWHADAPGIGAIGMLFAWAGAYAMLCAAAMVAGALALAWLIGRLLGRASGTPRAPVMAERAAKAAFLLHALAFAGLAAAVGVVAGLAGDGTLEWIDVAAFGLFGFALGWSSVLTEPAG